MSDRAKQAASAESGQLGAMLRDARQRMDLEISAVAASLHLEARIVVALEEGRQEELPAHAYVRGYVRRYARIVGLDAEQLVAMADASAVERGPRTVVVPPPPKPSLADRANRHLGWVFGGIVAVVLVAAAVVLWIVAPSFNWLPWQDAAEREVAPTVIPNTQAPAGPTPAAASALPSSEAPREGVTAAEGSFTAEVSPTAEGSFTADSSPTAEGSFTAEGSATTAEGSADPASGDEELAAASAAGQFEAAQDTLIFRFEEDSWVEVRDRDRGLIHSELGKAGDVAEVRGDAPFDILIGYALGVRLTFNGDTVALAPHVRQSVARLVVGQ